MATPDSIWIYRIIHIDNLETCLRRAGLCAPNHTPNDGLAYRTIHNADIQAVRSAQSMDCGPGGVVHDYVSFYFGPRSPMLYQLHTGWVAGYKDGQEPIIYLATTIQAVVDSGAKFVFSDGHGIATFTSWFDDIAYLDRVDWKAVNATWWRDTPENPDMQRRKQAEFLVHERCEWTLIKGIGVLNDTMKARVEETLAAFDKSLHCPVKIKRNWYY